MEVSRLGRVAVLDRGESARRVLRAIRELARAGLAGEAVLVHAPGDRRARFVREADEAIELEGSHEYALYAARAATAWLGPAPLAERATFAEACAALGVAHVGPPAEALRRLLAPGALTDLAATLQVPAASGPPFDAGSRVVEVVAARGRDGVARALAVGDASLGLGDVAVLAEAPAPGLAADEEEALRDLGVRACEALGWIGVCAIRLVFDPRTRRIALAGAGAFARSAPAIEAATGADLVRMALRISAGAPAEAGGRPTGHAIAARILARDPSGPPVPGPLRVDVLRLPSDPGVHSESIAEAGDDVPFDVPLATVVARGADRAEALARLGQALDDADVLVRGSGSSKGWVRRLLARPEVQAGEAGLGLLDALAARGERMVEPRPDVALLVAAIEAYAAELNLERADFLEEARRGRPRVGPSSGRGVDLRYAGVRHRLDVRQTGPDAYRVVPTRGAPADVRVERLSRAERRLSWDGKRVRALVVTDGPRMLVDVEGVPHVVEREPGGLVVAPMPAVVVAIPVAPGQEVAEGETVARIEAMKVETDVRAPAAGVVREVLARANGQVDAGAPLVRIEPLGDAARLATEPIELSAGTPAAPAAVRERYLAAIEDLVRLVLGFDLSPTEAKRLAAGWRELAGAVPLDDAEILRAEDRALRAFVDAHVLFSRVRGDPETEPRPALEELWRYLHEPEERGLGLGAGFVAKLRRALAHYGLSLDVPGRALEIALLRLQKSHVRTDEQLAPVAGILTRRLAAPGTPPGLSDGGEAVLDALASIGEERSPALADLARQLRYRQFEEPLFEEARRAAYVQVDADLAQLAAAEGDDLEGVSARLVATTYPIATLLVSRMASAPPSLRPRLVAVLLRRYFRTRALAPVIARDVDGLAAAWTEYDHEGRRVRTVGCFAHAGEIAQAVRVLARIADEVPTTLDVSFDVYVWRDGPAPAPDEDAEALRAALQGAGFHRSVRRVSFVFALPGRGLATQSSQQHFTFRGGPDAFTEDTPYRGVHPMLFRRMQLGRLSKFELERLPGAGEDVYLYRGVARANPKDERLFGVAEVRDLTPVRDASGKIVRLPHLERMLHEALAGMRAFQARRPPNERLEWNRIALTVDPPLRLSHEEIRSLAERLLPATQGVGLEMVLIDAQVPDPATGELRHTLLRMVTTDRHGLSIRYDVPTDRPLEPLAEYAQRVVQLRRRGLTHPFEIVRMLAPPPNAEATGVPQGEFVEHDLDASGEGLVPVERPPGKNAANMVVGVVKSFTSRHPEGMTRVLLLGDAGKEMGSLSEPECRRIYYAIELAEKMRVPLEWFAVSAGAKISMQSGTENMDWISRVLRRIVTYTQGGGELNVVVVGINVGAQPYWNAEATMLMHTRGILVMTPGSAMVLTGKQALEYSGSVSAEDNEGIGGYDRIMGPNGQAQYRAGSIGEAIRILLRHYDHTYVVPGERFPRRAETIDPKDRDVRPYPHGPAGGAGFATIGEVFSQEKNPDRKKPFDIRRVMASVVDADHEPLERWRDLRGGETGVVWDAHLGGWPVCLIGIESRPIPRATFVPADGPTQWLAGTLFPQSSKKIARAINTATRNRPVVVLANLSGFDGSPESMRRLQLEYGAEIGRAVVNFDGPIVFCVVSRYHGGAFVVFSKTLREDIEVAAVAGARASVIGGSPAAAVVFAREVETRTRKDPRVVEAEKAAAAGGAARSALAEVIAEVRSGKLGEVGEEFDRIHSVERALKVGSLDRIIAPEDLRPYLVDAVERGIARTLKR